jgi:hypothetical protein
MACVQVTGSVVTCLNLEIDRVATGGRGAIECSAKQQRSDPLCPACWKNVELFKSSRIAPVLDGPCKGQVGDANRRRVSHGEQKAPSPRVCEHGFHRTEKLVTGKRDCMLIHLSAKQLDDGRKLCDRGRENTHRQL